jgi:hypothetical protein
MPPAQTLQQKDNPMKSITRYVSVISVAGLLSSSVVLAQSSSAGSDPSTRSRSYDTPNSHSSDGETTRSSSPSNLSRDPSTASVSDSISTSIQSSSYANRSQLVADIEQRLDSHKELLKAAKKDGKRLEGQAKNDFKASWDEVEAREKDLKHSLRQARNASADQWDSARSQLAANFQAFEAAAARVENANLGSSTSVR